MLFICLGNICRSPTAEGVFRQTVSQSKLADKIHIDSAGTSDWHIGHPPDRRAIESAALRGIDLSNLKARQVVTNDMLEFDYIIAMDNENLRNLKNLCDSTYHHKIKLFLSYADKYSETEVPDPYYGGAGGFSGVLDMIENASQGLLREIELKEPLIKS